MVKKPVDMSAHFSVSQLLRYALPSMAMVFFTSIYGIVDGLFVSNFAGATAFAAVNFILPVILLLSSIGFMTGTGGTAQISMMRGKGQNDRANQAFSMTIAFTAAVGIIMAILGILTCRPLCQVMGAEGQMLDDCVTYGTLVYLSLPGFVLQSAFQSLMMAAGKPKLGLGITVTSGLTNIVLDFILVGAMGMGIVGAALATNVSEWLGGLLPVIYFARKNSSFLKLVKCRIEWRLLGKICYNGSSEMMTSIAVSLVSVLYNIQLLAIFGENGVAAFGVIMYVYLIFQAGFMGYCMAVSPLISYQYGAKNSVELRSLLSRSLGVVGIGGIVVFICAQLLAGPSAFAFCSYDPELQSFTETAFRKFYLCVLFSGVNVFGSSFFTALGNGLVSAGLSFARTLVFECTCIMVLPLFFGAESLWYACLVAEVLAFILVLTFIKVLASTYGYSKQSIQHR